MASATRTATTVGQRVADLRRRAGLRQQDIATALHMPRSAVAMLEGDHRHLSFDEAVRLADVLEVSLNELAGHEPDPDPAATHRHGHREGYAAGLAAAAEALEGWQLLGPDGVSEDRTPSSLLSSGGGRTP